MFVWVSSSPKLESSSWPAIQRPGSDSRLHPNSVLCAIISNLLYFLYDRQIWKNKVNSTLTCILLIHIFCKIKLLVFFQECGEKRVTFNHVKNECNSNRRFNLVSIFQYITLVHFAYKKIREPSMQNIKWRREQAF